MYVCITSAWGSEITIPPLGRSSMDVRLKEPYKGIPGLLGDNGVPSRDFVEVTP